MKRFARRLFVSAALAAVLAAPVTAKPVDPLAPTGRWSANVRGAAATPPMGWSSWNAFGTAIDEDKIIGTAKALVDTGLAKLGYRYVNIDDGWWLKRRQPDGRLMVRTNIFPSAAVGGADETSFRPLTDRLHAMGLKAGIYTDIGRNSCSQRYGHTTSDLPEGTMAEREIGIYGHTVQDARLFFHDWGFDYLKVDGCGIASYGTDAPPVQQGTYRLFPPLSSHDSINRTDVPRIRGLYGAVGDAIAAARPDGDFFYSICLWGAADVRAWGKDVGNAVRSSDDILPKWTRLLHNFDSVSHRAFYAHPGSWNDPDMLFIGHGEFDADHLTEARSHFALWAVMNAPLLIGYDMRHAPRALLDIWGNADLVRANQDPAGNQGVIAYDSEDLQIIVKTLGASDRKVVAVFNRGFGPVDVTLLASQMKFTDGAPISLRDLWTGKTLKPFTGSQHLVVAPRETMVFEATGTRALTGGYYLSEMPGRVNPARDGVTQPQADPAIHRMVSPWTGTIESSRASYTGWGGAGADENPYGQTIEIAGTPFLTGVGILANSRLEVRNDARFSTFSAKVGVDDNTLNTTAPVTFWIYGDGRLLARSRAMTFGHAGQAISADIRGVKIVELVARQAGAPDRPVATAWADAALLR